MVRHQSGLQPSILFKDTEVKRSGQNVKTPESDAGGDLVMTFFVYMTSAKWGQERHVPLWNGGN